MYDDLTVNSVEQIQSTCKSIMNVLKYQAPLSR